MIKIFTHFTKITSRKLCRKRGCSICALFDHAQPATQDDWSTEYLCAEISVKYIDDIQEAVNIFANMDQSYGSIITENQEAASLFLTRVDSAIVMHNASTQFADGGEFGMGAEIGIATGKIHARGPKVLNSAVLNIKYVANII